MINKKFKCLIAATAIASVVTATTSYSVFAATVTSSSLSTNQSSSTLSVDANSILVINETTKLSSLTIGSGATLSAPDGYSLTMTVNGIEKTIESGTFKGNIVLTVTEDNIIKYAKANLTHYFRQALYIDSTGIVDDKSVISAVIGGKVTTGSAANINIISDDDDFNGLYITDSKYTINGAKINFNGNGDNDFAGFGAGIMGTGSNTELVVNNTEVHTHGVTRPAIIAADGSNLIVKNSNISVKNGILPDDYKPNVQLGLMKSVPWMLGLTGNCRATNVLGDNTKATYLNSSIAAEGWGVLSCDDCSDIKLNAINSDISITGKSGYGAYAIGDAVDTFYGCNFKVPDYALIITGGTGNFGSSNVSNVSKLNTSQELGISSPDLKSIKDRQTTVKSDRFGVMWHGTGTVNVTDGTIFDTKETTFLVKGTSANVNVDGSKGAKIKSGNGVILQLMDNDDPGPVTGSDGIPYNTGVYYEPTGTATKDTTHDTATVTDGTDTIANLSNIELQGNIYNGVRTNKNLSINLDNTKLAGVISSSAAKHSISTITSADYLQLGEVTNTPQSAINNGMIVSLSNGSNWTVTGTSYLTNLKIADTAKINAPKGYKVIMTVNGTETSIAAGTYEGEIILSVSKLDGNN